MGNEDTNETRVYGRGWAFPLNFSIKDETALKSSPWRSAISESSGAENVRQAVKMLCQTQPGERIMRPMYGCDWASMVFANLSEENLAALRARVMEAVTRFEPRAKVLAVDYVEDTQMAAKLHVTVRYQLAGQSEVQHISGTVDVRDGTGNTF